MPPDAEPLRVADVALFQGERSGGIRTYLNAKRAWARGEAGIDHHVLLLGPRESHEDGWHELPATRIATPNGYRLPLGVEALKRTLTGLRPQVVLLHDPFWGPLRITSLAHGIDARVLAVHRGSSALGAAGLPGPDAAWRPVLSLWMRQAYRQVDGVLSVVDPRFGLHPEFRPRPEVERRDHVLYAGRLQRQKGVLDLVRAVARSQGHG